MNVPVIHVHTQSDKSTIGYAIFMWETMRELANSPDALKLSIHCIGPTAMERLQDLPQSKMYYVPNVDREKGMSGSTAHGACIEHALRFTDDGDIHLLVDSDTVVLAKGWDDYVRLTLLVRGLGMIGTAVEDIGGFTSGRGTVQMAKNLPTVAWCALSPLHSWRDLKAMPRKTQHISIANEALSKIYNLPVGYEVLCDVAWQIPEYLHTHKITSQAWKQLKPTKDAIVLKGLSDYHEEYHVPGPEGCPFVVHQRGSMRHAYRNDRISQGFYNAVDVYLAQERARETRWRWSPDIMDQAHLAAMATDKATAAPRIEEIERHIISTPVVTPVVETSPPVSLNGNVDGWLKAMLDGVSVWSRQTSPVPRVIDINLTPEVTCQHLRLEGTVGDIDVVLPTAKERPYTLTVRNLTAGSTMVRIADGRFGVVVPNNSCWLLLVDVDGVVRVE